MTCRRMRQAQYGRRAPRGLQQAYILPGCAADSVSALSLLSLTDYPSFTLGAEELNARPGFAEQTIQDYSRVSSRPPNYSSCSCKKSNQKNTPPAPPFLSPGVASRELVPHSGTQTARAAFHSRLQVGAEGNGLQRCSNCNLIQASFLCG